MSSYIIYVLKVCFGISLFVIPYFFFMRNDTNLNLKRFFLLSGVLLSFLIPVLALKSPEIINVYNTVFMDDQVIAAPVVTGIAESSAKPPIDWPTVILALYLCGALILLFRNVFLLIKWNTVWNHANNRSRGVAFSGNDEVFAIFSRIFLPAKLENTKDIDAILLHERAHIRQLHYIDLIILELTMLITWFNPFTWLISAMVKENHEHLADREVLAGGIDPSRYRMQLLNHTLGVQVFGLAQQFSHSLTKKRFEMMRKSGSFRRGLIKITVLVPLILLTLGFAVAKNRQSDTISGKVVFADTGEPAYGTSIVIANTTTGTIADKEGNFKLEIKEKVQVIFSYVGYNTQKYWFNPGEYRLVSFERGVIRIGKVEYSSITRTDNILPLIIVDGVKQENKDLNDINPAEIAKIKTYDKYGKEAGNDLIVITTKQKEQEISDTSAAIKKVNPDFDKIDLRVDCKWIPSNGPLVIVNGIEDNINNVDASLVETITALKDSCDIAVFGDRGAKGVILITTKRKDKNNSDIIIPSSGKNQKSDTVKNAVPEKVFYTVEEMPAFPGGAKAFIEFVNSQLEYPVQAKKDSLSGRVEVQFVVSEEGKVRDVKVKSSSNVIFNAAAIRAVQSSPAWKPGTQRGKPVSVFYAIPVEFKLLKSGMGKSTTKGQPSDNEPPFYVVEEMPLFNGGDPAIEFRKYIVENMKYPEIASEKGISGRVIVQFVVDTLGKVTDPVVAASADPVLDKEALRLVLSSPPWTPGKQRGRKVKVFFTFPLNFIFQPKPIKNPEII